MFFKTLLSQSFIIPLLTDQSPLLTEKHFAKNGNRRTFAKEILNHQEMENKTKNNRNTVLGIFVLAIGALLLLANFDLLGFPVKQYIFSWKTLLIGIGTALLLTNKKNVGGVILISLGVVFWIPEIVDHQVSLNQIFLPAVLIVFGILTLAKVKGLDKKKNIDTKVEREDVSEFIEIKPEESH